MTQQERDTGLILQPETLGSKVIEWKAKGFHVLAPAIQVSNFAPGYGVNASLVMLAFNPDPDARDDGDVYYDKQNMKDNERAPSKLGLMKIAAAAGISWVNPYGRKDPLTLQNLWIYQVTGVYMAYDGTPQTIKGEKEIDYRDGSAQIEGWSDNRKRQARCNGAERAETGALERAIRTLGVRHSYTFEQLGKPFVALRVCPVVNMEDPMVRALVADRQLAGVANLYAGAVNRPALSAGEPRMIDMGPISRPEPVREPAQAPVAAAPAVQAPAPRPAPVIAPTPVQAPPQAVSEREPGDDEDDTYPDPGEVPGSVTIKDVATRKKAFGPNHPKAGQEFTIWTVTDSNGVIYTTSFARWGNKAAKCHHDGTPVVIQSQQNKFQETEIMNIQAAAEVVAAPDLAGMKL